ncbi:transposase [Paenibacillus soyae]|uniref:Transposase n=1 Tax=Paenibacillus soyae TaxID=2969249 RepID=A0A9X2MRQ1_9BACL|nr:transposase [Paenibacillus soyae]MCR2804588.1 transposase [Paenibacillus soyae]
MEAVERFYEAYPDEHSCNETVEGARWHGGFLCPKCGGKSAIRIATRRIPLYECRSCGVQVSLTSGTIMHKSRTPLRKWLLAIYLVSCHAESVNAVQLSELIQVTYKTAWRMLHAIRFSISLADQNRLLSGHVDAKLELFRKQDILTDTRLKKEQSVIIACERESLGADYYKIKCIHRQRGARTRLSDSEELSFVSNHCLPNQMMMQMNPRFQPYRKPEYVSSVCPEGNKIWTHIPFEDADARYPLTKIAAGVFRWINNTFHGIGMKYAQHYLDEGCFRLNFQTGKPEDAFKRLLSFALEPLSTEGTAVSMQATSPYDDQLKIAS